MVFYARLEPKPTQQMETRYSAHSNEEEGTVSSGRLSCETRWSTLARQPSSRRGQQEYRGPLLFQGQQSYALELILCLVHTSSFLPLSIMLGNRKTHNSYQKLSRENNSWNLDERGWRNHNCSSKSYFAALSTILKERANVDQNSLPQKLGRKKVSPMKLPNKEK